MLTNFEEPTAFDALEQHYLERHWEDVACLNKRDKQYAVLQYILRKVWRTEVPRDLTSLVGPPGYRAVGKYYVMVRKTTKPMTTYKLFREHLTKNGYSDHGGTYSRPKLSKIVPSFDTNLGDLSDFVFTFRNNIIELSLNLHGCNFNYRSLYT
jgi:hypothetical protein